MGSELLRQHQQQSHGRSNHVPVTQLFTRKELVGKGAYGGVYKGIHNATGQVVALKIIDLDTPDDDITEIQREVQLLSEMRDAEKHNITMYHGSYLYKTELWIVMDFASGGSIRTLMKSGPIEERYIVLILREVLVAMSFLHRQGIIHRDIKAANILLTQAGQILLADFGVAAHLQTNNKRSTFIGTPLWMAPEVITDGKLYDTKADIWGLGITLYEIATGNPPYFGMEPLRACALIPRSTPAKLEGGAWSLAMKEFLAECLQVDPEERPTADELSTHKWIRSASKVPMSLLKELIARYVAWVQMGGQRQSLVGMDSLVKDDTFDIEDRLGAAPKDAWDFDTDSEHLDDDEFDIEPLGDEPPRASNSRFVNNTNDKPQQANARNHPLLRLFQQSNGQSSQQSLLSSSTASSSSSLVPTLPSGFTDTVKPMIAIPSFDEMEEMASSSSASIELPADLLSPATYKPSPFSWTSGGASSSNSSFSRSAYAAAVPFDEEEDDRFETGPVMTSDSGYGGELDMGDMEVIEDSDDSFVRHHHASGSSQSSSAGTGASSWSSSVGPSPSLPSLSMNRPFQLNRRRADTAPSFEHPPLPPAPFPPPMPAGDFTPTHSANTSFSSSSNGLSNSTGSTTSSSSYFGHRSNASSGGQSWAYASPTPTPSRSGLPSSSRNAALRNQSQRTEVVIAPVDSGAYANRPFRTRVDSDLATRSTSLAHSQSSHSFGTPPPSSIAGTSSNGLSREDGTRPRNFSDPRANARLVQNPGLKLGKIPQRPMPVVQGSLFEHDSIDHHDGLASANAFDFPTPIANVDMARRLDSFPFPSTSSPPPTAKNMSSASNAIAAATNAGRHRAVRSTGSVRFGPVQLVGEPDDDNDYEDGNNDALFEKQQQGTVSSVEWPMGPPPRPLNYGSLFVRGGGGGDQQQVLQRELEKTIGGLASWLAIVDDGLTRILSGPA